MNRRTIRPVGRPRLPDGAQAKNVVFRLRPDVEQALDFVVGAGGHKNRAAAFTSLIRREATRLRRDDDRAFAGRVAVRADTYARSATAGGARMDRAERVLQAYVVESVGEVSSNKGFTPVWSFSVNATGATIEADDDAVDCLASHSVGDICNILDGLGVKHRLGQPKRYIGLTSDGANLRRLDRRPASFRR